MTREFGCLTFGPSMSPRLVLFVFAATAAGCAPGAPAGSPDAEGASPAEALSAPPAPAPPAFAPIVASHNELRAAHCAPPLGWSDELARVAQGWADKLAKRGCNLEHNQTPYGENLASATPGSLGPDGIVRLWYAERAKYDHGNPKFSMTAGHFTQLVWVGTRKVGCGVAKCADKDVWVCDYDPAGNVQGQFRENVLPTTCKR
jgi:pathogenesis-related protein 1